MKSSHIIKVVSSVVFFLFLNNCSTNHTAVQTPPQDAQVKAAKISTIQRISFKEEENYTRIQVEGSEPIPTPFLKLLSDPLRIAIDIPKVELRQIKGPIPIHNGTISEISTTQYDDKGRVEIVLVQMANYNISREDKNLIIDIEKVKQIAEGKEVKREGTEIKEKGMEIAPTVQPPTPPPLTEEMDKAKAIVNVLFEQKKDFIIFNIIADGKIGNYDSFKLDSPTRLVLDIWEVDTRYAKRSIKIRNPFIKNVRIGSHPDKLRFVFDSLSPQLPPYQINRIQDKLIVSLGNVPQYSEPQILMQPSKADLKLQERKKSSKANLTEVNFKQMDHKSRIVVALTEEPQFETHTISKNRISVDIKNAFAPQHLQRGLDTSEFDSAVKYVSIKNIKRGKKLNDVRISIQLREEMPFETTREGKNLFIDIMTPQKIETKLEALSLPKKEELPIEAKGEEIKKETEPSPMVLKREEKVLPTEEGKKTPEISPPEKIYIGRKLSLDFKDADVKNILRLIAEVSNLNIIAGDDVTGKITMRLVEVPWDQALDVILQARALEKRQVGNVVRVAPRDTMKKEDQVVLEAKRAQEKLEDLVDELIPVNYATAKEIITQVKSLLSDRGDVKVDDRTNTLIVKDIPKNISRVKHLVKALDTKTPQVLIEARVIEANLTFQRELGVSWGIEIGGGKATTKGGLTDNKVVDLPASVKTGTAGIIEFIFSRGTIKDLDIAISAHQNKGDVRIISSPKIATLDNKEASIEQGLRLPIPKVDPQSGQISIEYVEANLRLVVTPHVTNDGNIKMNIKVKKDAPDFSQTVGNVPSIDKKEAITEVLIRDGGIIVIAGVYSIEKSDGTEGIPLFSKIPLLGYLFKREAKEDKRKDLLIFVSPKIIKDQI